MNSNKGIVVGGLAVLALIACVYFAFFRSPLAGVTLNPTGPQHLQMEAFTQGATFGLGNQSYFDNVGRMRVGATGDLQTRNNFGKCIIFAYATTIAASSTATVDCQAGASALTPLTGVTKNDNVFVQATTTLSATSLGVKIIAAAASSTSGYITMTLVNETGTTFTWSGTASSSMQYYVIK